MGRPVNAAQRKVLDWLAAGGTQNPPEPEMKLSAAALKSRGLVRVTRPAGKWTAELTAAGRHFLEHDAYPPQPEPEPRRESRTRTRRPPAPASDPNQQDIEGPDVEPNEPLEESRETPIRQVIRKPHPAIRELMDRPGRLPKEHRRRCLLILHSLTQEALARGWSVAAVKATVEKDRWGTRTRRYDDRALLIIDAGHAPIGVVVEERQRQVDHVDTAKEARDRAAGKYVDAPRFDYVPTGLLRLHLTDKAQRKTGNPYDDGTRVRVEDKLPRVIDAIEEASTREVERAEAARRRREEDEARRQEAQRVRELRSAYESWESTLHKSATAWHEHRRLTEFLDSIEATNEPGAASTFIAWAREHLDATDPRKNLPTGEAPTWTHQQRTKSGRFDPTEPRRWY